MYEIIETNNHKYKYLVIPCFNDLNLLNYDEIAKKLSSINSSDCNIVVDNIAFMGVHDSRRFIKCRFRNNKLNKISIDTHVDKSIKELSLVFYIKHKHYLRYSVMANDTVKEYLSGRI